MKLRIGGQQLHAQLAQFLVAEALRDSRDVYIQPVVQDGFRPDQSRGQVPQGVIQIEQDSLDGRMSGMWYRRWRHGVFTINYVDAALCSTREGQIMV